MSTPLALVSLLIGLLAYRALLLSGEEARDGLEAAMDTWFFEPKTDMAPWVIVGLSVWLFYRARPDLRALPDEPGSKPVAIALLGLGCGTFAWATSVGAPDLLAVALIFTLLGFAVLRGGAQALRVVGLPTAVLLFAVPIPAPLFNEIVFQFQIWTSDYAGWILYQLGIPGFVSGDQIVQYGKRFVVIESCSGLRSVETLTMLAVLLVDLFHRKGLHAALIVVSAPLVAFALNGFRVVGLILNPHSRVATVHTLQGVAILLAGLVLLYILDGLLARLWAHSAGAGEREIDDGSTRELARTSAAPAKRAFAIAVVATLALQLVAAETLPAWSARAGGESASLDTTAVRRALREWRSTELDARKLRFFLGSIGLRQMLHRRYRLGGEDPGSVDLFLGVGIHSDRISSPLSPKTAYPGSGWAIERESSLALTSDGPVVQSRVLRSGTERILAVQWYEGADDLATESLRALVALDRSPWRRERDAVAVRLSTRLEGPTEADVTHGERRLTLFYTGLRGALDASQLASR